MAIATTIDSAQRGSFSFFRKSVSEQKSMTKDPFPRSGSDGSVRRSDSSIERSDSSRSSEARLCNGKLGPTVLKIATQEESLSRKYGPAEPKAKKKKNRGKDEKATRFSKVKIHFHTQILGDNPAVSAGPPVALSWEAIDHERLTVNDHQHQKLKKSLSRTRNILQNRNTAGSMTLSSDKRMLILLSAGVSRTEITNATRSAHKIQEQRLRSSRERDGWFSQSVDHFRNLSTRRK